MYSFKFCHPNDLFVTMNKMMKTRLLLRSPQMTEIVTLDVETLSASVPFMIVTPRPGEETTAVGLGRDRVVVVSLGEYFVVIRMGRSVSLVIGMMTGVNTSEEPLVTTRRTGWKSTTGSFGGW